MQTNHTTHPPYAIHRRRRAISLAALAGVVAGVYACSDATGPVARATPMGVPGGVNASATVTPGVVTLCKVGPGAEFNVQVGLTAPVQSMTVNEGSCTTLPTITAAPGDDVIVSIAETAEPYYVLDHIVLQHGEGTPQPITGTNSVSFEGVHGALVTFFNHGLVTVCKEGTNATLQYEVGLGTGFTPLALNDGQCSMIARIPPVYPDDMVVTIRENGSPSYQLDHIALGLADLPVSNIAGSSEVSFEGSHGAVVVFHNVPVPPGDGCTYTQGWYKNQGSDQLPAENFYLSGDSRLTVLQTPPKGNPYYVLAEQFIPASINAQSASTPPAVSAALSAAATYFGVATPANWSAGGNYTKGQLTGWAGTLGAYNEGSIGPGHCG